jgi:hypothetical protein
VGRHDAYRPNRAAYWADKAIEHLHRLVDHQDDPCEFDHHGTCQAHFTDGSEPGKCGVAEARAFLARFEARNRRSGDTTEAT